MKLRISLRADLVKEVRKIAAERQTTVARLVRDYLQGLAAERVSSEKQRRQNLDALERSFRLLSLRSRRRPWRREDLYERRP